MISHVLTVVLNELNSHMDSTYGNNSQKPQAALGNLAEGFAMTAGSPGLDRNTIYLSIVNISEESALKNTPNYVVDSSKLTAVFENPPVFLNFKILLAATHSNYNDAILMLSRAIRFFQYRNVFTRENVDPSSISDGQPLNPIDRIETFKLIFDLYSASMEEVNHMWGTLGGKQYPFVLYRMRMLDLKFKSVQDEMPLIKEVIRDLSHLTTSSA
ncbi:DUF4255 domain-containing protein [Chlorobium sp.]|uniref:DUF4255 domain-containing protein n=1 Tax=Chlorobium sp. TaxID=1095 RepID=UPI002F409F19